MKLHNYFLMLSGCLLLAACGSGSSSEIDNNSTVNTNPVPFEKILVTADILAAADAPFITSQSISYTAYNSSEFNITLFVLDSFQNEIARQYIKANNSANITVQLPIADSVLNLRWNYRENVYFEKVELTGLSSVQFTGFNF